MIYDYFYGGQLCWVTNPSLIWWSEIKKIALHLTWRFWALMMMIFKNVKMFSTSTVSLMQLPLCEGKLIST